MSTIGDVREALATRVRTVAGLQRSFERYPGSVTPPASVVRRLRTHPGTEFNGGHTVTVGVSIYLPSADAVTSGEALDVYLDPHGPVYAAVMADTTLGGVVRSIAPAPDADVDEEALVTLSGVEVLAGTIPFTVVYE